MNTICNFAVSEQAVKISSEDPRFLKKKEISFSDSSRREKFCGKVEKVLNLQGFPPPQGMVEKKGGFPRVPTGNIFLTLSFSFSP